MKKTKIIITAAIMAALVTATACGGKDQASTPTEAKTTTVVKQVNSTSTEKATDKQEITEASVENTASSNEEVLVAEAVTEENQGNSDSVEEINNTVPEEQPAEDTNAGWTDTTPAEQPVEEAPPVKDTNSGAVEEAPAEDTNGVVEETPVEQPIAPEPAPEPTPEPVVTPQEPAAPTLTDEERLVATGKWIKRTNSGYTTPEGNIRTTYDYIDPVTGYSIWVLFDNGQLTSTCTKTREEYMAITAAHNNVMLSTIEGLEQL